ncbi:MAG: HepT-like ribonuclease domain-containing protein [Patescibacteria group bacterium]
MINPELEKKVLRLQEYMDTLFVYVLLDTQSILKNKEKLFAMERAFLLTVDEAIDINAAIVYQIGGSIADSYKSTFYELASLKIIDLELAEKLADSAKIRNQLTHDYEKLQKKDAVEAMKKFHPLFKEYLRILIEKFIRV